MSIKLEVGKSYKTRGGWKATIVSDYHTNVPYRVFHNHKEHYHMWHLSDGEECSFQKEHDLIAEWGHEVPEVDLTKITTPFGLLDKDTQERLKAHGYPYEWFTGEGWDSVDFPAWNPKTTYRVKPKPFVEYKRLDFVTSKGSNFSYLITEKFVDGKYDSYTVDMVPF